MVGQEKKLHSSLCSSRKIPTVMSLAVPRVNLFNYLSLRKIISTQLSDPKFVL